MHLNLQLRNLFLQCLNASKLKLLPVFILVLLFPTLLAQYPCGTIGGGAGAVGSIPQSWAQKSAPPYYIKLYIHAIRQPDGCGGVSEQSIDAALSIFRG